jgi:putative transcriptional regulator
MTFGEELIQSAREALAIAQGKAEPAAITASKTANGAAIGKSDGTGEQPPPGPKNPLV